MLAIYLIPLQHQGQHQHQHPHQVLNTAGNPMEHKVRQNSMPRMGSINLSFEEPMRVFGTGDYRKQDLRY